MSPYLYNQPHTCHTGSRTFSRVSFSAKVDILRIKAVMVSAILIAMQVAITMIIAGGVRQELGPDSQLNVFLKQNICEQIFLHRFETRCA